MIHKAKLNYFNTRGGGQERIASYENDQQRRRRLHMKGEEMMERGREAEG